MIKIYTIGHSVKEFEHFLYEIQNVGYDYLIDVRSKPYSRFVPQYNRNRIYASLGEKYIWMGDTLGGMDENISTEDFHRGIQKISDLAKNHVLVLFCSEGDYRKCHREFKIRPELESMGFKVIHL